MRKCSLIRTNNKISPFDATKYITIANYMDNTRQKAQCGRLVTHMKYVAPLKPKCRTSTEIPRGGKYLRTRCQKTTFGLCGHACLTTCVVLENIQRDAMRLMALVHSASHLHIIRGRRPSHSVYSWLAIPLTNAAFLFIYFLLSFV